jgi:eukaryotic-like serine/threonine-protein kinase
MMKSGSTIGPYEITREIGRGGMGVVYLANDTRLDREVAIKALPEHLANDPDRLSRFEREAKTLASLNHPNIAAIYGFESFPRAAHSSPRGQSSNDDQATSASPRRLKPAAQDETYYLILEYVEGETLAERLDRGPIPVDEALEVCVQIAAGVEAAHDAGVIHRDLKPGNIIITPEGKVKVLDFGLAKVAESSLSSSFHQAETVTSPANRQHSPTMPGVILGTAAYMSPEQARGRSIDKRTDIWSFGVVLYECLAGLNPFVGETVTDSIGAILHKDVDLNRLPPQTPPNVRRVLRRCLERDKATRYRDIGDARLELVDIDSTPIVGMISGSTRRRLPLFLGTALVLTIAVLSILLLTQQAPPPSSPVRVTIEPPAGARILFSGDLAGPPVVSPDGKSIAFCALRNGKTRRLWIRRLDEPEPRELSGTEGALFPFWSPDSKELAYFDNRSLRRFDLASGTVLTVVDVGAARGGAWTDDGRIIYTHNFRSGLYIVDANGGAPAVLTTLDEGLHTSHRWPFVIPGTNWYLFSAVTAIVSDAGNNGIYLGMLDSDSPPKRLMASDHSAAYIDGWLLHVRGGVLLATRLDLESGATTGRPVVLARGIAPDLSTWHGQFSASPEGVMALYRPTTPGSTAAHHSYSWAMEGDRVSSFSYDGRLITTYASGVPMYSMSLSPNGRMLAMDVLSPDGLTDIWIHHTGWRPLHEDVATAILPPQRLTFLPGAEYLPRWSPDGSEVAFRWDGDDKNPRGIYRKRIGGGSETLVRDNQGGDDHPSDWTPDGRYLIVTTDHVLPSDKNDIIAVPLDGGPEIPLVTDPGPQNNGRISPDGKWLAYQDYSSRSVIYVIPFTPAWPESEQQRKWLISENGGYQPRWSRKGDELYYVTDTGTLIAVDVDTTGESFSYTSPRVLFQSAWRLGRTYDPTPDAAKNPNGFMFLDSDVLPDAPISLILNWQALLEKN